MAGTVAQSVEPKGSKNLADFSWGFHEELTFTCVGDSSDGSIPDTAIDLSSLNLLMGTYLSWAVIKPGTPNPTANADVTLKDEYGFDVLGGQGANALDATGNAPIFPMFGGYLSSIPLMSALTLSVTNQSVASAQYNIICGFTKMPMFLGSGNPNYFINDQSSLDTTRFTITGTNGKTVYMNHGDGNITTISMDGSSHDYDIDYGVGNEGTYTVSFSGDLDEITDFRCAESSISGDMSWLGNSVKIAYLSLVGTDVSGDIGNLGTLVLAGTIKANGTSVSGDISGFSTLSANLANLYLYSTNITGALSGISGLVAMEDLRLYATTISGDIADLVGLTALTTLNINGTSVDTYTQGTLPDWDACNISIHSLGLSEQEVDDFLVDLDTASSASIKTINISGTNAAPSATGREAILNLVAKGWTVVASDLEAYGSVTQAEMKQSLVDGTAFIDQESLGASLWDAGADVLTSGTYHWTAYGTNTIDNVGNELEITYDNKSAGALCQFSNSADLSSDLTLGAVYKFKCDAYYTGGSAGVKLRLDSGVGGYFDSPELTGSKTAYTTYFVCADVDSGKIRCEYMGASNVVYIDNLSIQLVSDSILPYAGADSGAHDYFIEVMDSAGKIASGWIGAIGGGETLGSELIVNGDFANWTGDDPDDWSVGGESGNDPEISEVGTGEGHGGVGNGMCNLYTTGSWVVISQSTIFTSGMLLLNTIEVDTVNSGGIKFGQNPNFPIVHTSTGSKSDYFTTVGTSLQIGRNSAATDITFDDVSVKQVTDCSANGVHIISTVSGSTQSWTDVEAGFDYNDSSGYTYAIYAS